MENEQTNASATSGVRRAADWLWRKKRTILKSTAYAVLLGTAFVLGGAMSAPSK